MPGLLKEIGASVAAANPMDAELQVFSAEGVTKLMAAQDACEDQYQVAREQARPSGHPYVHF